MPTTYEPAIFYPFRRHYSDRIGDLEALGMPENLRRADQVAWLKGLHISADDIAWLLGIDYSTTMRYLSQASPPQPHRVVVRDRLWKHTLPDAVAKAQAMNERDRAMLRAHQAGATYRQISAKVGICVAQVGMQMKKAQRRMREGQLTPVEDYFMDWYDIDALANPPEPPVARCVCPTCGRQMTLPIKEKAPA